VSIQLSHLELHVTDLEASASFAEDVCRLRVTDRGSDAVFLSAGRLGHELVLRAATTASCGAIGLAVGDEAELEAISGRLRSDGVEVEERSDLASGVDRALRFRGPDGQRFEVAAGTPGVEVAGDEDDPLAPRCLGHVSLKTPDPVRLEDFLVRQLGLRVSDRVGDRAMWLRANSDHHGIAVMREPAGLHHYAFEIAGWDSFKAVGDHLRAHDRAFIWGPGRHGPGNNLFAYFLDPEGCVIEFYAELEEIEDEARHEAGNWVDRPETFNLWGPGPPVGWHDHGVPLASVMEGAQREAGSTGQGRLR
jgi:catechol-2,3-dioxygenase